MQKKSHYNILLENCFPVIYSYSHQSDYKAPRWAFLGQFTERMGGGGQETPHPKISYTYLTMMELDTVMLCLKKIQKYESRDTLLNSAIISIFSLEISKSCYFKKYRYRLHFGDKFNF